MLEQFVEELEIFTLELSDFVKRQKIDDEASVAEVCRALSVLDDTKAALDKAKQINGYSKKSLDLLKREVRDAQQVVDHMLDDFQAPALGLTRTRLLRVSKLTYDKIKNFALTKFMFMGDEDCVDYVRKHAMKNPDFGMFIVLARDNVSITLRHISPPAFETAA